MKPHGNPGVWRKTQRRHFHQQNQLSRPADDDTATLDGIEERWLEREADAIERDAYLERFRQRGPDPELELVALTTPNVQFIQLPDPDAEA
jgi:hypothetical protein